MAHHDPQLWRRHKERKQREGGSERPQLREAAAMRRQRQRIRALRERMRGSEEFEYRA